MNTPPHRQQIASVRTETQATRARLPSTAAGRDENRVAGLLLKISRGL